jgi:hypothetical protein
MICCQTDKPAYRWNDNHWLVREQLNAVCKDSKYFVILYVNTQTIGNATTDIIFFADRRLPYAEMSISKQ